MHVETYIVSWILKCQCSSRSCTDVFKVTYFHFYWKMSKVAHMKSTHMSFDICPIHGCLLALFVGQRLCINLFVSRANFLTTLHSHLDVICSCYFWFSLFYVNVNYSYIYLVNYNCSLKCIEKNLVNYSYFGNC